RPADDAGRRGNPGRALRGDRGDVRERLSAPGQSDPDGTRPGAAGVAHHGARRAGRGVHGSGGLRTGPRRTARAVRPPGAVAVAARWPPGAVAVAARWPPGAVAVAARWPPGAVAVAAGSRARCSPITVAYAAPPCSAGLRHDSGGVRTVRGAARLRSARSMAIATVASFSSASSTYRTCSRDSADRNAALRARAAAISPS